VRGAGGIPDERVAQVDRSRLADRVYDSLKEAILDGRLAAGERLTQENVARWLGVSRSPVREALIRLSQEGHVRLEPRRGAVVTVATAVEMDAIYEVRELLEPAAGELAAARATEAQIAEAIRMQEAAEAAAPSIDLVDLYRWNADFHRAVIAGCGNHLLVHTLVALWERQVSYRMFALYTETSGAVENMLREHRAIVDALAARRSGAVRQLLRDHLRAARLATAKAAALHTVEEHTREALGNRPGDLILSPSARNTDGA
jgi:DNA-binding GntR family transcriptional regulator